MAMLTVKINAMRQNTKYSYLIRSCRNVCARKAVFRAKQMLICKGLLCQRRGVKWDEHRWHIGHHPGVMAQHHALSKMCSEYSTIDSGHYRK